MSKLFDTLEQIRSNESSALHPTPESAQTKLPESRKKIVAAILFLCAIATGLVYYADISSINLARFFSRTEHIEKKSILNTSLPVIQSQGSKIHTRKDSKSLPAPDNATTDELTNQSLQAWQKTLQKSSLSRSERAVTFNNIGSYYIFQQQHWKGLAYLDKALAIEPENPVFLINFGVALTELGMVELATQYFLKARKITPNHPALIKNIALLRKTNLMPTAFNNFFNR